MKTVSHSLTYLNVYRNIKFFQQWNDYEIHTVALANVPIIVQYQYAALQKKSYDEDEISVENDQNERIQSPNDKTSSNTKKSNSWRKLEKKKYFHLLLFNNVMSRDVNYILNIGPWGTPQN